MVQIVAHRGSSGNRPENTLPAFAEAVRVKADIIELDVHLSKDEQLIVMHDETRTRVAQTVYRRAESCVWLDRSQS